jgi:hypothetical protein
MRLFMAGRKFAVDDENVSEKAAQFVTKLLSRKDLRHVLRVETLFTAVFIFFP